MLRGTCKTRGRPVCVRKSFQPRTTRPGSHFLCSRWTDRQEFPCRAIGRGLFRSFAADEHSTEQLAQKRTSEEQRCLGERSTHCCRSWPWSCRPSARPSEANRCIVFACRSSDYRCWSVRPFCLPRNVEHFQPVCWRCQPLHLLSTPKWKSSIVGWASLPWACLSKIASGQLTWLVLGKVVGRKAMLGHLTACRFCKPSFAETKPNYVRLFACICDVWRQRCAHRQTLEEQKTLQVHKDFHPSIEEARREIFPLSRACDDFFHMREKSHTVMQSKCAQVVLRKGKYIKKNCSMQSIPSASYGFFQSAIV